MSTTDIEAIKQAEIIKQTEVAVWIEQYNTWFDTLVEEDNA